MGKRFINLVCALPLLVAGVGAAGVGAVRAAEPNPVTWRVSAREIEKPIYEVVFDALIESPWHLYDLGPYGDFGPNPTLFTFDPAIGVELVGEPYEITPATRVHDPVFDIQIGYFADSARFGQRVRLDADAARLRGTVEWMACDESSCLPPAEWDFAVTVGDGAAFAADENPPANAPHATSAGGLLGAVVAAILWGLAAVLTPCVYPMIPLTISFFLKNDRGRARGRWNASLYGIFIVLLYTLPIAAIILITWLVGGATVTADIFNWLSTHWAPNVLFFIVFLIFAASFFGAFEITMPGRWVNRSDTKADRSDWIGIFFLALTLVLVSFSCTGVIVGNVLLQSTSGAFWQPIATMFAFAVAFALPFVFFAFFPELLKKMPGSGGWMNEVKVVIAFLELALGLKFLSMADQTYHWSILDREIYLALWIVIFALMGIYLLGKIRFKHDSPVKYISVGRLMAVIATFGFVVYLLPGMWGAPLKGISGLLPPLTSQDFVIGTGAARGGETQVSTPHAVDGVPVPGRGKHSDFLHLPLGLEGFFDLDEGLAYARRAGKPVMVNFTGHGCVNCREMEMRVWSDPRVLDILRDDFVIVALYSDDKKRLPESEWIEGENRKLIKTLGRKNSYIARTRFGANAQPYYLLLDGDGELLVPPRGYNLSVDGFSNFLRSGLEAFRERNPRP